MFSSSYNQRFGASNLDFELLFFMGIRKRSTTNFSRVVCVHESPRILSILRFFDTLVQQFRGVYPSEPEKIKNIEENSMKTSQFWFLKVSLLLPFQTLFSIANIHSYSSTKILSWYELSKLKCRKPMISLRKVDFGKIGPNSLDSYISRRATSYSIQNCVCFSPEMFSSFDNQRFGAPINDFGLLYHGHMKPSDDDFHALNMCLSTSPYSFYTRVPSYPVRAALLHIVL